MKKKAIIFIAWYSFFTSFLFAQHEYKGYLNVGIPLYGNVNWNNTNITADLAFGKKITNQVFTGIGASYYNLDLNPSLSTLTYDRQFIDLYAEFNWNIDLSEKMGLSPGIRFGYVMISYTLNEFDANTKKRNSLSVTPLIAFLYRLNDHLDLMTGLYFHTIFVKPCIDDEFVMPLSYMPNNSQFTINPGLKIGIAKSF